MTDELVFEDWDLAEVISETRQPKDDLTLMLDKELSSAKAQLEEVAAGKNGDELAAIEKEIADIEAQMTNKRIVVHLQAVPDRMLEDIESKALSKYPKKMSGMFTDENQDSRAKEQTILIWQAQIIGLTNSRGQTKKLDEDQTRKFYTEIPPRAKEAVSGAILKLNERSQKYIAESKNPDF